MSQTVKLGHSFYFKKCKYILEMTLKMAQMFSIEGT